MAYFTAIFPYLVLTILLVRAVTIPGHMKGIEFFISPNWTMLGEPRVWGDAAVQVTIELFLRLICVFFVSMIVTSIDS